MDVMTKIVIVENKIRALGVKRNFQSTDWGIRDELVGRR